MKNLFKKIKDGMKIGAVVLPLTFNTCCTDYKEYKAIILEEQFLPRTNIGSLDTYTAKLKNLDNDSIFILEIYDENARGANLLYKKGDTIKVTESNNPLYTPQRELHPLH